MTNTRDERVRDVVAILSASEPLSSDDPSAFVSDLRPGESEQVTFHLDVSGDAIPKDHPVTVEVTYTDDDGNERTAGPYAVAVRVTEQPGSGFPLLPAAVVVVALAALGVWWWRRRG